jgi:N-methylhydantoinase B
MAELDVNEGVVPLIEMTVPGEGDAAHADLPGPVNARTFVILRLLGVLAGVLAKAVDGRMPADQETIRYTGVYGTDDAGSSYLMREVLGGGSGGRYYADGEDTIHVVPDSRNLPTEFTESRFPFLVERLGWRRTPAARGSSAAGSATTSTSGCCATASSCPSRTARSWPAGASRAARRAGRSRRHRPGRAARARARGLVDDEPVRAGEVIRIRTTGGGGWGDPLDRATEAVVRDVLWGKVSTAGARDDYGVVVAGPPSAPVLDVEATDALRARLRAERGPQPFFDRGPGYALLSGGAASSPLDWLDGPPE